MTALHYAAREDAAEYARAIQQLLTACADVNAQDHDGWTPLHLAASHECSEIHSALIDGGANIVTQDKFRQTPLHVAASESNTTLFRRLLKLCICRGLEYMTESIFRVPIVEEAAKVGCVPILRMLANSGVDVARNDPLPHKGSRRRLPPLHLAVINSYPAAMDYLLARGTDPLTLSIYGRSVGDWALLYGDKDLGERLQRRLPTTQITRTPYDARTATLRRSTTNLATALLSLQTSISIGTNFYTLGKCLQYLDDFADAAIAYSQDPTPVCCDRCQKEISPR
jgi:ankyrin repeat protein